MNMWFSERGGKKRARGGMVTLTRIDYKFLMFLFGLESKNMYKVFHFVD